MKKKGILVINPTGTSGGNHETRLHQLIASGRVKTVSGEVNHIKIEHDNWCGLLAGALYCNCYPTINGIRWGK